MCENSLFLLEICAKNKVLYKKNSNFVIEFVKIGPNCNKLGRVFESLSLRELNLTNFWAFELSWFFGRKREKTVKMDGVKYILGYNMLAGQYY